MYTAPSEGFMLMMKIGALGGLVRRAAVHHPAAVAVRRAGALLAREALRDSVRACSARSSSSPAPRSRTTSRSRTPGSSSSASRPTTWSSCRTISLGVLAVGEDAAGVRRHLPDADDRVLPRPHGRRHGGLPHQAHQVRGAHHLHPGRRPQPRHGHGVAADHGRPDARPLRLSIGIAWLFGKPTKVADA